MLNCEDEMGERGRKTTTNPHAYPYQMHAKIENNKKITHSFVHSQKLKIYTKEQALTG